MQLKANKSIVFTVIIIRLISASFIVLNPLWGFLVYMFLDYVDAYFLLQLAGLGWKSYVLLDKKMDILGLLAMTYLGMMNGNWVFFVVFLVYRMIGELILFVSKKQEVLIFFPSLTVPYFIWAVLMRNINSPVSTLVILFILQEALELHLHFFNPRRLRKNGYPKILGFLGMTKVKSWD